MIPKYQDCNASPATHHGHVKTSQPSLWRHCDKSVPAELIFREKNHFSAELKSCFPGLVCRWQPEVSSPYGTHGAAAVFFKKTVFLAWNLSLYIATGRNFKCLWANEWLIIIWHCFSVSISYMCLHLEKFQSLLTDLNKILNNKTVPARNTAHVQDTRLHHRQIHSICLDALTGMVTGTPGNKPSCLLLGLKSVDYVEFTAWW